MLISCGPGIASGDDLNPDGITYTYKIQAMEANPTTVQTVTWVSNQERKPKLTLLHLVYVYRSNTQSSAYFNRELECYLPQCRLVPQQASSKAHNRC